MNIRKELNIIMVHYLVAILMPPGLWILTMIYVGAAVPGDLFRFFADPLIGSFIVLGTVSILVFFRQDVRKYIENGNDPEKESFEKYAVRVRLVIPKNVGILLLFNGLGMTLSIFRLNLQFPYATLIGWGINIGNILIFLLMPLIITMLKQEQLSSTRVFPDKNIPVPIQMRIFIIVISSIVGVIMYLVSANIAVVVAAMEQGLTPQVFVKTMFTKNLVIGGLALVGTSFNLGVVNRQTLSPLSTLAEAMNQGKQGDLTYESDKTCWDEIGYLSDSYNDLLQSFRGIISNIKGACTVVNHTGSELRINMTETSAAIQQINANIQSTRNQVLNQSSSVIQTSASVEEISKNIESLNRSIENQSSQVIQSSSAVEEMIASSSSIKKILAKADQGIIDLRDVSTQGQNMLEQIVQLINQILGNSENLREANTMISSVASQTNLLAMNAAIEAAHAGEAGKGFSVVADEIRKLAVTASDQSTKISQTLGAVLSLIQNVSDQSNNARETFSRVTDVVGNVTSVTGEVSSAMDEQENAGREVLSALKELNEITSSVQSGSNEMASGNQEILNAVSDLTQTSSIIDNAIEEIATGTKEIDQAMQSVIELNHNNEESIAEVVSGVSRFKVEP